MKNMNLVSVFAIAITVGSTAMYAPAAFAVSCTEQGKKCETYARTSPQVPVNLRQDAISACRANTRKCKVSCKAGDKVHMGVLGTTRYPVDTCG